MKRGKADAVFNGALNFYQPSECFNEMETELKWGVPVALPPLLEGRGGHSATVGCLSRSSYRRHYLRPPHAI